MKTYNTITHTDLSYITELSGGDHQFMTEIIQTFVEEMAHLRSLLRATHDTDNAVEFGRVVHKIKNRLNIFASADIKKFIENFDTQAQKPDFKDYITTHEVERLILYSERIATELSGHLKNEIEADNQAHNEADNKK
jgi:HPt (histidine-containing phosphotransfer) domain-containing protein